MEKINAKVFKTVAATGSFRKTADLLGYTQAGISYIINTMEKETGLTLFTREHDGVKLSSEGMALLPMMTQLESWQHQFEQTVNEIKGLEKGSVRVQIFNSMSIHWIPGIVQKFHDDFPGIKIELVTQDDSRLAEQMVANQEVDCGFFQTEVASNIATFPLTDDYMKACVSSDHPLADKPCFPLTAIDQYPYIHMKYDEHSGVREIFRKAGVQPKIAFNMDNDYAAMAMVSKGLGFAIFPELLLQDMPYDLVTLDFDKPQYRKISIGTASMEFCSGACRKFIEYTRKWVKENT